MPGSAPSVKFFGSAPVEQRPLRVVVAEDDPDMRSLITSALVKDGFEVTEVADGSKLLVEVVSRAGTFAPDLVISDVRMPVSSGLQVLRGLRRAGVSIPFIVLTAFGDEPTRREAERLGACYLEKPFDLEHLRGTVRASLRAVLDERAV
jgi:DNA-binding response OmpR family regulator